MLDDNIFKTLDVSSLPAELRDVLVRVAAEKGRAEITNADGATCVILSKDELESLEAALEILANTDGGKRMHRSVKRFINLDREIGSVPAVSVANV